MNQQLQQSVKPILVGVALLALAGCGEPDMEDFSEGPAPGVASVELPGGNREARDFDAEPAPPVEPGEQAGAMLAYSYSMGVEAPKGAVSALKDAHEAACMEAGPNVCQVLGSSVNSWDDDHISANLNLRGAPAWLATFRDTIVSDAGEAGGRITSNSVNAEDLTAYIIDLDARLEAKLALRERIKNLLATQEGSLSDILAAERALADVQGEIDSMTAQLAAARARVSMSMLSISYRSDPTTSSGVFKPLREALKGFFRTSVASLAEAVDFVARAWPFFLISLGVLFILRRWWRGRRAGAR